VRRDPSRCEPASGSTAYWDSVVRQSGGAEPPLWRVHADRATSDLLARWLPDGCVARILKTDLYDETCTAGLVPLLASRARLAIGIDVSPLVAATAVRRSGVRAAACDVRQLPFRADSFDVVVSNSTLDHFARHDDIAAALREIERVLTADGFLVVTLDNPGHPLVRVRNALAPLLQRIGVVPYLVGATHGRRGLHAALVDCGFEPIELTAVHHLPRLALVALQRLAGTRPLAGALRAAGAVEELGRLPTRWWTGQYVAALARPRRAARAASGAAA